MNAPLDQAGVAQTSLSQARVSIAQVRGRSVVTQALSAGPLRLLMPENHGPGAWVFQSSLGGGFVGKDRLALSVEVGAGAACFLSSQAASKVYRASRSAFTLEAAVGDGGLLVSWPDPVVCFADASLVQEQRFSLGAGASLLCVDAWTAGRVAHGERWAFERLETALSLDQEGAPVFRERQVLSSKHGSLVQRLGPASALATVLLAGPRFHALIDALAPAIAALPAHPPGEGAMLVASRWPWGLVLRLAAPSTESLALALRERLRPAVAEALGDDPFARKW